MKRVGYFTAHEPNLETTGQSGGVEFAFEFNSGTRKPSDSGEWGDNDAPRRREAMEIHDLITEWE